jgi:hypothetical protein
VCFTPEVVYGNEKHVHQSFIATDRTYGAMRIWFDMPELGYE